MSSPDDNLWDDLLMAIEEGQVVPVLGRDLALIQTPTGAQPFHRMVAEQLAKELDVPASRLPPDFDTNDVICGFDNFHGDPTAISPRVVRILKNLKVAPPESLRQLAEIRSFGLFLSTSFDSLLEQALTIVRGSPPAVVAFPPASNVTDFDEGLLRRNGSVVFQMLGRATASDSFAITEGQVLEQMHEFMAGARRPEKLIAKLQESHLLILGVGFPDWLARFLLRLARAKPLWDSRPKMEVIADGGHTQKEFASFLKHFSPQQSRLFTNGSPVDFVKELHRRWFERNPQTQAQSGSGAGGTERPADMERGSVFVSYASEDQASAFKFADELTAAGLEVWVDRRLNPGDDYRYIIERNIRECCAFVPIISRHTQTDDERYFRKEWSQACERARFYFGTDRSFLFPVVVDSTPMGELNEMRREIFGCSAARALAGAAPTELLGQLDRVQKAWRKQNTRA